MGFNSWIRMNTFAATQFSWVQFRQSGFVACATDATVAFSHIVFHCFSRRAHHPLQLCIWIKLQAVYACCFALHDKNRWNIWIIRICYSHIFIQLLASTGMVLFNRFLFPLIHFYIHFLKHKIAFKHNTIAPFSTSTEMNWKKNMCE